jgi:hypothetical protein
MRIHWQIFAAAAAMFFAASASHAEPAGESRSPAMEVNSPQGSAESSQDNAKAHVADEVANEVRPVSNELTPQAADTDLLALMSGRCSTNIAGRDFACKTVAYAHGTHGRAHFTIVLEDPADHNHIISFSGENGLRTDQNLYELPIDRMLLNSKYRPRVDGIPVPSVESSAGKCTQIGSFATGLVSSIVCSATDKSGKKYELRYESDGSPITLRRVLPAAPSIRKHG